MDGCLSNEELRDRHGSYPILRIAVDARKPTVRGIATRLALACSLAQGRIGYNRTVGECVTKLLEVGFRKVQSSELQIFQLCQTP